MARTTTKEQFWQNVEVGLHDQCWEYVGKRNSQGYGQFTFNGHTHGAHRFSWALTNGPIPKGLYICHHCDNPPCVNPSHLFLGTHQDNMADMVRKRLLDTRKKTGRPKHFPWSDKDLEEWRLKLANWMIQQKMTARDLEEKLGYGSDGLLVRMYLGRLDSSRPPSVTFCQKVEKLGFDPENVHVPEGYVVSEIKSPHNLPWGTKVQGKPVQCPECAAEAEEGKRPWNQTWYIFPWSTQRYCCVEHRRAWYRRQRKKKSS